MNEVKTLSSRIVYHNPWMTVREDEIEFGDGHRGIYGVVEKRDFAVVAAIEHGQVHLVQQYRYAVGARHWELPQGAWAPGKTPGEPLELARNELREETGIVAATMRHVCRLHQGYGYSTQCFDFFLASGLTFGEQELEAEEQGLISRAFAVGEALAMIDRGEITDAVTVAAFGMLKLKGWL